jgi:hypothetical protein
VHVLVDKPISEKVNRELHQLLMHDNLELERVLQLLCAKHRADLLIFLFSNGRFPDPQALLSTLSSILHSVL